MKFFREKTKGMTVCMGYNTLLSFPGSKPLKNRVNIVLAPEGVTRDDCVVTHTLKELSLELKKYDQDTVFVIGGAMFYKTMLPYCSEVYVTKVKADGEAILTALYPENGAILARLCNFSDKESGAVISTEYGKVTEQVDLLGNEMKQIENGKLNFGKWEIKTVKIEQK